MGMDGSWVGLGWVGFDGWDEMGWWGRDGGMYVYEWMNERVLGVFEAGYSPFRPCGYSVYISW